MAVPTLCDRCQRVAPAPDSSDLRRWEPHLHDDGTLGLICPGCLTREEDDDIADLEAKRWRDEH